MGDAYRILQWVEREGEPRSIARVRMMVLVPAVDAGVNLFKVQPNTQVPAPLIDALRAAAAKVVGRSCPV